MRSLLFLLLFFQSPLPVSSTTTCYVLKAGCEAFHGILFISEDTNQNPKLWEDIHTIYGKLLVTQSNMSDIYFPNLEKIEGGGPLIHIFNNKHIHMVQFPNLKILSGPENVTLVSISGDVGISGETLIQLSKLSNGAMELDGYPVGISLANISAIPFEFYHYTTLIGGVVAIFLMFYAELFKLYVTVNVENLYTTAKYDLWEQQRFMLESMVEKVRRSFKYLYGKDCDFFWGAALEYSWKDTPYVTDPQTLEEWRLYYIDNQYDKIYERLCSYLPRRLPTLPKTELEFKAAEAAKLRREEQKTTSMSYFEAGQGFLLKRDRTVSGY